MVYTVNGEQLARRTLFPLNASAETLTDYQKLKTIAHKTNMQAGFGDIRFTTLDGTNIPYWIESKTDSVTADVWLKISSISTTTGAKVWMYYGNPNLSSASSGSDVFEFYDDFSDGSTTDAGDLWITAGNYASNAQSYSNTYSALWPNSEITLVKSQSLGSLELGGHVISMRIYFPSTSGRRTTVLIYDSGGTEPSTDAGMNLKFEDGNLYCYDGAAYIDTTLNFTTGWNLLEIIQHSTTHDIRINSGSWKTGISNRNTISNVNKIANVGTADAGAEYFDNYIVRKNATEPTWAADGEEQHQNMGPQFQN